MKTQKFSFTKENKNDVVKTNIGIAFGDGIKNKYYANLRQLSENFIWQRNPSFLRDNRPRLVCCRYGENSRVGELKTPYIRYYYLFPN